MQTVNGASAHPSYLTSVRKLDLHNYFLPPTLTQVRLFEFSRFLDKIKSADVTTLR